MLKKIMLEKFKVLVPLDQSDILGAAHKDTPPDYKLVFEEGIKLAKALCAEVVLLHIAMHENKEGDVPSNEPISGRFDSPEDSRESSSPRLELEGYAGAEVYDRQHGERLEFETTDGTIVGLRDLFVARALRIPEGKGFYEAVEDLLDCWSIRLTREIQKPIQTLLERAGDKEIQTRAMILMMDIQGRVICKAAQKWEMNLIVMGRGKAAAWRSIWTDSSASTHVLYNSPCSVVLVDEHLKEVPKIEKILVALDYSPTSRDIFLQAVNLAERIRAVKQSLDPNIPDKDAAPTLLLLHVTSPFEQGDPQMLNSSVAWAQERLIPVESVQKSALTVKEYLTEVVLQPDALPGQVICETATEWGADLIVIGYRREWELKKLVLGSVCNYVTHHAPCSVFVAKGFNPFDPHDIEHNEHNEGNEGDPVKKYPLPSLPSSDKALTEPIR